MDDTGGSYFLDEKFETVWEPRKWIEERAEAGWWGLGRGSWPRRQFRKSGQKSHFSHVRPDGGFHRFDFY